MEKRFIALIPSYEPGEHLLSLVKELNELNFSIVVVNDGSGEKYKDVFSSLPDYVDLLQYDINKGKGYALKYGLKYIKDNFDNKSIIVTLDSDGQHKVSDAFKIANIAYEKENTLVLGSRFLSKDAPKKSRVGNWWARTMFLLATKTKIYDTQTGLRAFDYSFIEKMLEISGDRFEYEMNVLLFFSRHKINIFEERIETIYLNNNSGTHYSPFKDSMKIFFEIIKFSLSSGISFLVDYGIFAILTFLPVDFKGWLIAKTAIARVISASVNFTLNYNFVFKGKKKLIAALGEYVLLAIFILLCNFGLIYFFVEIVGIPDLVAKLIVETTLFIVSWLVQRLFVFRKKKDEK